MKKKDILAIEMANHIVEDAFLFVAKKLMILTMKENIKVKYP